MSDPLTLLLSTCNHCLDTNTKTVENNTQLVAVQSQQETESVSNSPQNTVTPPETMTEFAESAKHNTRYGQHNTRYEKLNLGHSGESVRQLQLSLQELGHYSGAIDGIYGKLTQNAVKAFQTSQNLTPDGITGTQTWQKLQQITTPQPTATITPPETEQKPESATTTPSPEASNIQTPEFTASNPEIQTASMIGLIVVLACGATAIILLQRQGKLAQWQLQFQTGVVALENAASGLPDSGDFDRPVMLQQSPTLPKAIAWTIVGVAVFAVTWASVAKIEQVVPATGQLKPQGTVKEIQAPVGGVVAKVHVVDGEKVQAGDLLISFDPTTADAELKSLQTVRNALLAETNFYRTLMTTANTTGVERQIPQLDLPPEALLLAKSRLALTNQNRLYRTLLAGETSAANLDADERAWLATARQEFQSRATGAGLSIAQLEQQLRQNQAQLVDAQTRLATDQNIVQRLRDRNSQALQNASNSLDIEEQILSRIAPLVEEGAVARVQYDRQRQEVTQRSGDLLEESTQGQIQLRRQLQEVNSRQAEIAQLAAEQRRLQFDIAQARAELNNTTSLAQKDVLDKIAVNKNQIAEIDSQLSKIMVENQKRIAEIDSQISQAEQTFNYQELRAPVAGTVFNLQATNPGFVAQQAQPLVTIVPEDSLVAEIYIASKDIGFVRADMSADVRIESFPFSEFGEIDGEVISVGSDSLPPDEQYPYPRFPAKVKLNAQTLNLDNREISLQSGMAVDVNIKVREDRRVINLLTELFTKKVESLEEVR